MPCRFSFCSCLPLPSFGFGEGSVLLSPLRWLASDAGGRLRLDDAVLDLDSKWPCLVVKKTGGITSFSLLGTSDRVAPRSPATPACCLERCNSFCARCRQRLCLCGFPWGPVGWARVFLLWLCVPVDLGVVVLRVARRVVFVPGGRLLGAAAAGAFAGRVACNTSS